MARTDPKAELIRDRRTAPRIACTLPAVLRDAAYAWKAEVLNFSSSGCLLRVGNQHPVGKQMELELRPEGRMPTKLRGRVVHMQAERGTAGFGFDLTKTEDYEATVDLFEWYLAQQPGLAVEVQKRPVALAKSAILYPVPDSEVQPRPEEARFLTMFVGGRTLADAERLLGPQFQGLMYLVFSLLDRKLLTSVQPGMYKRRD